MDLATSQFRFGLLSLVHCSTLFLMHGQKKHFFEDKPLGFSCYSALISAGLSLCLILFSSFLEKQVSFSFSLIASDVLLVSLLDAAYAYVWFVGPIFLYAIIKKRGLKGLFTSVQKEES